MKGQHAGHSLERHERRLMMSSEIQVDDQSNWTGWEQRVALGDQSFSQVPHEPLLIADQRGLDDRRFVVTQNTVVR